MKLLRRLLTLIIVLALIVATPVFLLYKSGDKPAIDGVAHTKYKNDLKDELDYIMVDTNANKEISVFINEGALNYAVNNAIEAALGEYTDSDDYVSVIEDTVFIQGAWFKITDKSIKLNIGAHIKYSALTFKTLLLLDVELVEFNLESIKLKINKLNVGKLPFKFLLKIKTITNILNNTFNDIGSFDSENMTLEFNVDKLLGDSFSNDPTFDVLKTIITENEIIDVKTETINNVGGFTVNLNLNPIEYKNDYIVLNNAQMIHNETEYNQFLLQKITAEAPSGKITFSQIELSALINYSLNLSSSMFNIPILDDYQIAMGNPFIKITDKTLFNVPLFLEKGSNKFKSNISAQLDFIKRGIDLEFSFNKSWWGDISIDNEVLNELLKASFSDLGQTITITNFFETFENQGIVVSEIKVENNKLVFEIE